MQVSSTDRTYDFIRERLISGGLGSAERLREAALAREIGVSRTPVREALRRLQSEGLILQTPGCGASVRTMNEKELREIFELRELLETHAVRRIAGRLAPKDVAELEVLCEEVHQIAKVVHIAKLTRIDGELRMRSIRADLEFHRKLIRMTGNSVAAKMLDDFHILSRIQEYCVAVPEANPIRDLARIWREHRRILRAIVRGDASVASQFMAEHLQTALEQHLHLLERLPLKG